MNQTASVKPALVHLSTLPAPDDSVARLAADGVRVLSDVWAFFTIDAVRETAKGCREALEATRAATAALFGSRGDDALVATGAPAPAPAPAPVLPPQLTAAMEPELLVAKVEVIEVAPAPKPAAPVVLPRKNGKKGRR